MKIKITKIFEPVKDKPGYYWLNKRNYTIISKEVLEEAFKKYEDSDELLLSDTKFQTKHDSSKHCPE